MRKIFTIILLLGAGSMFAQSTSAYQFAVMQYSGGGDWYSNPTSVPNLVEFCNDKMNMKIDEEVPYVEVGSEEIFDFPFVHVTGHGNVVFNDQEIENLRTYLMSGGFLHIDDNFGMDEFIRPQMLKVFPDLEWIELPFSHAIYHQKYDFEKGLPKVHDHDKKAPQGYGLIHEGRLICFYTVECDLGDGWEDRAVHMDSEEKRQKALQMGANIVSYVFIGEED